MSPEVQSPQPVRWFLPKSSFDNIADSESPPTNRPDDSHLPPESPLTPPTTLQRKRRLQDQEQPPLGPRPKKFRFHFQPSSLVERWLLEPFGRASTAPPPATVPLSDISLRRPRTAPPYCQNMSESDASMPPPPLPPPSPRSKVSMSVNGSNYRDTISRNGIVLDPIGLELKEAREIQQLLEEHILCSRPNSPPLSYEARERVAQQVADLMDSSEAKFSAQLIATDAFPKIDARILLGQGLLWSNSVLPYNPRFSYKLSTPKPDYYYGINRGRHFDWTDDEVDVINHPAAMPYAQPTKDVLFPFLSLEFKSEYTGGTLYVAENQGVGSAVHCVVSHRWFLKQASIASGSGKATADTDAIAFTVALSPRLAVMYVAWYASKKQRYVVSKFKNILFSELDHIQQCRDIISNILDYGLRTRVSTIRSALADLSPPPASWQAQGLRRSSSVAGFAQD